MSDLSTAARDLLGADVQPLDGGYSGETFAVEAAGEQAVLRLYLRQPERAAVDTALHQLVHGILPVPRVLEARPVPEPDQPAYLLLERVPGVRLDTYLAEQSDPTLLARAGSDVGRILGQLSGIPYLRSGEFVGPELEVRRWEGSAEGLPRWVESHRTNGRLAGWTADEFERLVVIATDAQALLDTHHRVVLCHSDVNPKNLLVDPDTGGVVALLDWEYAHAGMPHADLGNLLRFETVEPFCAAVVSSYRDRIPDPTDDPREMLELGRAADLFALVDLAGRERQNRVTELANALLRTTIDENSLAAGRPDWTSYE